MINMANSTDIDMRLPGANRKFVRNAQEINLQAEINARDIWQKR